MGIDIWYYSIKFGGRVMIGNLRDRNDKQFNFLDGVEEKQILVTAIEQASVAILITDINGDTIYVNPAFEKISGYTTDEIIGKNPRILKSGLTPPETYEKMWKTISSGEIWNGEQINKRKDGSLYCEDSRITPIYDNDGSLRYYLAVKHDITERKKLEAKLKEIAIRDPLTNAYNRRYLMERLNQIADNYKRVGKAFSIGILDIDSFKQVNDQYGHQAGDRILVELVNIISKNIRSYDILCRYGGEEFLIVLPDTNKEETYNIIKRILKIVRCHIFKYEEDNLNITFSAGISESTEIPLDDFNVESLIKLADCRLYKGKNTGRDQIIK